MTSYKLSYFNVKGLGEPIRFLLSYGGVDFEDVRIERSEWPKFKHSMPFGQMPVLEIDGKAYTQTLPICHYLGKKFNIAGKTDLDGLEIAAIANAIYDFRKSVGLFHWEQDPALKAQKKQTILKESLPYIMSKLDDIVKLNGGYFHGGELSYADFFFAAVVDHINGLLGIDLTKDYPNLRLLNEKILAIPQIASWVAKRPKTDF